MSNFLSKQELRRQAGVSIIELGIVMIIMGILVASVVGGQALVEAAKIRALIVEYEKHQAAFDLFLDKYEAIPGDMRNATTFWPGSGEGNGNARIEWGIMTATGDYEGPLAWDHLANAGFAEGSYTLGTGTNTATLDLNMPGSKYDSNSGFSFAGNNMLYGNHLVFGGPNTVLRLNVTAIMPPADGDSVDRKLDDGYADRGNIRGLNGTPFTPDPTDDECFDTDEAPITPDPYNIITSENECILHFILD